MIPSSVHRRPRRYSFELLPPPPRTEDGILGLNTKPTLSAEHVSILNAGCLTEQFVCHADRR